MIEEIVLSYLKSKLDVPVHMEAQSEETGRYVLIEKIGSSSENYINTATFAFQSYADSMYEAAKLNEQVKNEMDDIVELASISRSELNSDYNYTDTTKKKYRYQAIYDLVY